MNTQIISLGSTCEVAHNLRKVGMRLEGYPFDYITTIDSSGFLKIIEDDFKYFLDDMYLVPHTIDPYPIFNKHYKVEFLHEGIFNNEMINKNIIKLKERYNRRIERFRNLKKYNGEVIFIRHSYEFSVSDPHRIYKCEDNIKIDNDYANKLYAILKNYFGDLDFKLIIINHNSNNRELTEEYRIHDKLIICNNNIHVDLSIKSEKYKLYLSNFNKNIV